MSVARYERRPGTAGISSKNYGLVKEPTYICATLFKSPACVAAPMELSPVSFCAMAWSPEPEAWFAS